MKVSGPVPVLYTSELQATLDFYERRLGFECVSRMDDHGWAELRLDRARLMLTRPNAHLPFPGPTFTGSLYFHVDDVDTLWEALRETAEVCYPLETFDYGMREFAIYDNNRYLLQFGQEVSD